MPRSRHITSFSVRRAISRGHLTEVERLLNSSGLSHQPEWLNGYSLLLEALKCKRLGVAKYLLAKDCSVNYPKRPHVGITTPLHVAVALGNLEVVKILLDRGAHVNASDDRGDTPLHVAARRKHLEVIKLLVESGAHINALNYDRKSPIIFLLERACLHAADYLIDNGADVNNEYTSDCIDDYSPIHLAVQKGSMEMVKLLLSKGAEINAVGKGKTPLHIATHNGYPPMVKLLLDRSADLHSVCKSKRHKDYTPLLFAVEKGNDEVVTLLMNGGANVNECAGGYTPLHIAARNGLYYAAESLLKYGANVNCECTSEQNEGYAAIHFASEAGSCELVELLVGRGARVNDLRKGYTPLHIAAMHGFFLVAKFLIKHGADVNCVCQNVDNEGYTPIHLAVEKDCYVTVKVLLNAGANVNEYANGYTPLHIAALKGHSYVAEHLLEEGADVNSITAAKHDVGFSPIFLAVMQGHEPTARVLLTYGCRVDDQDPSGKSILLISVERGDVGMVELILQHSPDVNKECNRKSLVASGTCREMPSCSISEILLQYGFTVTSSDVGNYDFFFHAIKNGYISVVESLLQYGANVNHLWYSSSLGLKYVPLHYAIFCRRFEIAELLISYKADVNVRDEIGRTPLFYAMKNGYYKHVHVTLSSIVNEQRLSELIPKLYPIQNGYSRIMNLLLPSIGNAQSYPELLTLAIKTENVEVIRYLIKCGASVNFREKDCRSAFYSSASIKNEPYRCSCKSVLLPIHAAVQVGNLKIIDTLLEYNADVNSVCICGLTALHIAVKEGNEEVVRILLKSCLVIDSQDRNGMTALHHACSEGHSGIVRILLNHGCDVNVTDVNNYTPLVCADIALDDIMQEYDYYDMHARKRERSLNKILEMLKLHRVKSKYFLASMKNIPFVEERGSLMDFHKKCMIELGMMRHRKINTTEFSLFDIMTKSVNHLALLLENENISSSMNLNACHKKFPKYASMICSHFRMAERRKKLMKEVNDYSYRIFSGLTWDCIQIVISYLSSADLFNLMQVLQCTSFYDQGE